MDAEQKDAEQKELEALTRAIARHTCEGAVMQNQRGEIVSMNQVAVEILGVQVSQCVGRTWNSLPYELIREDGSRYLLGEHPAELAGASGRAQRGSMMGLRRGDGTIRWIRINSFPIDPASLGSESRVLSTFVDMTAETEAARNLQQTCERYRLVLDNIPALVAYLDGDERCQFANRAYLDWFGYSPGRLIGTSMFELLGPALYQFNKKYIEGVLAGQLQTFDRDLIKASTGELRHTKAQYLPDIYLGKIRGFYVLVFDVTEIKALELEAKRQALAALEASRSKSEFLANMSHEIRTPMNGVIGMAGLLAGLDLTETQKDYVETINSSAKSLLTIINDILDFSKVEAGMMSLEVVSFELRCELGGLLKSFEAVARSKSIALSLDVDPNLPDWIEGDPDRLRQVLTNLIANSLKFTARGSVAVRVRAQPSMRSRRKLRFSVEDTGIGIPKEAQGKLFSAFSQVDSSMTRKYGGTGLGLAICRRLVDLMGGDIWVESEAGRGSVFIFELEFDIGKPVGQESPVSPLVVAGRFTESCRGKRVLVVDDHPINRKVALLILERLGIEVVAVADGEQALEVLKSESFDLVLMDCQMPVLDGYRTTELIRESTLIACTNVPIFAMTASAHSGEEQKCLAVGMNGFVPKPLKIDQLIELIERVFLGH